MKLKPNFFALFLSVVLLTFSSQAFCADGEVEMRYSSLMVFDQAGKPHVVSGEELEGMSKKVDKNATMSSRIMVRVKSLLKSFDPPKGSYIQFSDKKGQIVEFTLDEALRGKQKLALVSAGNHGEGWKLSGKRAESADSSADRNSLYMRRVKEVRIINTPSVVAKSNSRSNHGSSCANSRVYTSISEAQKDADTACIINLSGYGFSTIPAEVYNFPNLKELVLSRNNLSELPAEIAKLSKLEILIVGRNNLKTLPESIGQLKQLKLLKAGRNQIDSVPAEIGGLTNLTLIEFDNNFLKRIPDEVGNMTSLKKLELAYNQIEALPESLTKLSNLEFIEVAGHTISAEEQKSWESKLPGVDIEWE